MPLRAAIDQRTDFDNLARQDVQAVSLQIDIHNDGLAGPSRFSGKENCVKPAEPATLAKRLRREAASSISHVAQRRYGASRAGFGRGTAPHSSHLGGRTWAATHNSAGSQTAAQLLFSHEPHERLIEQ